jgi:predicted HTH domain antitoxin
VESPVETLMGMLIDDELLHAARMSEPELKLELAALLYQRERLTLGQAARLAGLSQARLRLTLGARGIPPNYGVTELAEDLAVVRGAA